ncbi:MAG: hypothetical protein KBD73_03080 [Candidatus Magasanikbacteria bacterium]|nr:hypothetical protein [Candidatus Magasanikbacteria bacterium]
MNELPEKGTREYVLADILSRPNALNGLYSKLKLPLEWEDLNKKDAAYITHVADLADRVIKEAIESGKNLEDQKVQDGIQAAVYGGATGASFAMMYHKLLVFLGVRK